MKERAQVDKALLDIKRKLGANAQTLVAIYQATPASFFGEWYKKQDELGRTFNAVMDAAVQMKSTLTKELQEAGKFKMDSIIDAIKGDSAMMLKLADNLGEVLGDMAILNDLQSYRGKLDELATVTKDRIKSTQALLDKFKAYKKSPANEELITELLEQLDIQVDMLDTIAEKMLDLDNKIDNDKSKEKDKQGEMMSYIQDVMTEIEKTADGSYTPKAKEEETESKDEAEDKEPSTTIEKAISFFQRMYKNIKEGKAVMLDKMKTTTAKYASVNSADSRWMKHVTDSQENGTKAEDVKSQEEWAAFEAKFGGQLGNTTVVPEEIVTKEDKETPKEQEDFSPEEQESLSAEELALAEREIAESDFFAEQDTLEQADEQVSKKLDAINNLSEDIEHIALMDTVSQENIDTLRDSLQELDMMPTDKVDEALKAGKTVPQSEHLAGANSFKSQIDELAKKVEGPDTGSGTTKIVNESGLTEVLDDLMKAKTEELQLKAIEDAKAAAAREGKAVSREVGLQVGDKGFVDGKEGTIQMIYTSDNGTVNFLMMYADKSIAAVVSTRVTEENVTTDTENEETLERDLEDFNIGRIDENGEYTSMGVTVQASNVHTETTTKEGRTANALHDYLMKSRDKSEDQVRFTIRWSDFAAKMVDGVKIGSDLAGKARLESAMKFLKDGTPMSEKDVTDLLTIYKTDNIEKAALNLLRDVLPISFRVDAKDGSGGAGGMIHTKTSGNKEFFASTTGSVREELIKQWRLSGMNTYKNPQGVVSIMGVHANWAYQVPGVLNKGTAETKLTELKGFESKDDIELFIVKDLVGLVYNKEGIGDNLYEEIKKFTGGTIMKVKDLEGKDFLLKLHTKTLEGTPELELLLDIVDAVLKGDSTMASELNTSMLDRMAEDMPKLLKAFGGKTLTMGDIFSSLVSNPKADSSQEYEFIISPGTKTVTIGQKVIHASEYTRESLGAALGTKRLRVGVNKVGAALTHKNRLGLSADNPAYLEYLIGAGIIYTNIKAGEPIFTSNEKNGYLKGGGTFMDPSSIKQGTPEVMKAQEKEAKAAEKAKVKPVAKPGVVERPILFKVVKSVMEAKQLDPSKLTNAEIADLNARYESMKRPRNKISAAIQQDLDDAAQNVDDSVFDKCRQ